MSDLTAEQATVLLNAMAIPSLKAEYPVTKRVIAATLDLLGISAPESM